ncbi:MAG TPA: N-acetylmuramoyl-L-alanine amidase, partial [Thiolinea sp.]|nr:N-acetylmuramoyl-L-alanine amidase [Thiolinea sp.]
SSQPAAASPRPAAGRSDNTARRPKDFIVVIDPGHGGRDPGAVGVNGTLEKAVVLEVGRKLKNLIDRKPGMKAILTRSNDSFVPLRQRIDIARRHNADLFVSVHADANPSSRVKGSTVYILSENGASSEAARLLAESENSYELRLGDVRLTGSDAKVASILLDLSQSATMDRSLEVAKSTLAELSRINNPLRKKVESAGFVVLKAPDIPSMLVETAFISNPTEEKRLRTADYQQRLAEAMFRGIHRYQLAHSQFENNTITPEPALLASTGTDASIEPAALENVNQDHVVQNGDSLSVIAEHYGVSVSDLKRENALQSNTIRTGQKLKIPTNT